MNQAPSDDYQRLERRLQERGQKIHVLQAEIRSRENLVRDLIEKLRTEALLEQPVFRVRPAVAEQSLSGLKELERTLEQTKTKLVALTRQHAQLQAECTGVRHRLKEAEGALALWMAQATHVQMQSQEQRHHVEQVMSQLEHMQTESDAQLQHLSTQLEIVEREAQSRELIIQSLTAQLRVRDDTLQALAQQTGEQANQELESLRQALVDMQEHVVELTEQLHALSPGD